MAPAYFELANPRHFWCMRRFEVLQSMAGDILRNARNLVEIGCGSGVLMKQVEDAYSIRTVGFDLHEGALRKNLSRMGSVYCYDIHQRDPEFGKNFDVVLLFDVLEHISDEVKFLESVIFHLAPDGYLIVNVPALQWLYSPYDKIQGHCRRYSLGSFHAVMKQAGLSVISSTYWGAPLVPVALLRKLMLSVRKTGSDTYAKGFDPGSSARNEALMKVSRLELVPQKWIGTSVMAVLKAS